MGIFLQTVLGAADSTAQVAQAASTAIQKVDELSLWSLIQKGGWILIPIGLLSIVTVYIFVERWFVLNRAAKSPENLLNNVRDQIHGGNIQSALMLCKSNNTPDARMLEKGISRIGHPVEEIEKAMEGVGKKELSRIEKNVGVLAVIAGIAPMFGFVGTIMGVIKIFYNISLADNISIGIIAGGLYEKMITSAAGLIVGIIAFVLFHYLNFTADRVAKRMEATGLDFIDMLHDPARS
ncbi:MAG: MotA/TolQ/ExbB proton channel family protein [Bacteroidia bacterium]|jgi:biopolymer transport protein ExbB|nr:MotA/TolQ/ExbB proton channel family protein [Bacteroidia bacterium]MCC6768347.1 MotA/TolQ/ExbB proton channel family protein [Bacteroidia bacterium]